MTVPQHKSEVAHQHDHRAIPITRQATGRARTYYAHVLDRVVGRIVRYCGHRHRSSGTADACAHRMAAEVLAERRLDDAQ